MKYKKEMFFNYKTKERCLIFDMEEEVNGMSKKCVCTLLSVNGVSV